MLPSLISSFPNPDLTQKSWYLKPKYMVLMEVCVCRLFVSCSELASEKAPTIRQEITSCISEAFDRTPSIVIFDDLDSIISSSSDSEGAQPSKSAMALTEFLTDIMDEYAVFPLQFIYNHSSKD